MKISGRILIISVDNNLSRILVSYSRTAKELYNSLLMYVLGSQIEDQQEIDLTELANYATKLRSYKAFDPDIAIYTLAYMLHQIDEITQTNDIQTHFKELMSVKYFPFILPHKKLQYDADAKRYVGNIVKDINVYIAHRPYRAKCIACVIPFISQDGSVSFSVELTKRYVYLIKYVSLIKKVLTSHIADTTIIVTPNDKPFNEFNILGIDIGSKNFVSCIPTTTFEPFVINADYIFNLHKTYMKKLNSLDLNSDTGKISDINTKIKKVMKRFISRCTQYLIKYCINNDICDIVVGIVGNRCISLKYLNNVLIGEFNFAPLLQSIFRSELQNKCVKNGLKFYEINEYRTSSMCCRCGHYDKKSRNKTTNIFTCSKCNLMIHGDINAAINILKRYCKNYFEPELFRDNIYTYIDKSIDYENMTTVKNILVQKPKAIKAFFD